MNEHLRCPPPAVGLTVGLATAREELSQAYQLVYRSYISRGYIDPHPGGLVYHEAFGLPSTRTIVAATEADGVVGTLTVVGDNALGLELDRVFPLELRSLRERGRNVCEVTCLAIDAGRRFRPTAVFFAMTKFMLHYALSRRYDDFLMACHPRHYTFYWHHYRAYLEGSCRPYESVKGSPAVCCRIDLRHLYRNMSEEMRQHYFSDPPPLHDLARPPLRPADHEYFCLRGGIIEGAACSDRAEYEHDAA